MSSRAKTLTAIAIAVIALVISLLWSGPDCWHPRSARTPAPVAAPDTAGRPHSAPSGRDSTKPAVDSGAASAAERKLIIPVEGVTADKLVDTYTQARANGRVHDAIDILAPHNTPVRAATSGTIKRLFLSKPGGTTIYELSPDEHTVYYYAHLDHYATGITEGVAVRQGQTIGYVGDTGDAGPGNYHLHFAIWKITDPKNFWEGQNINPYPILRRDAGYGP